MSGAPPDASRRLVLLGRVGAAHGLRGDVRLQSFTHEPAAVAGYGRLYDKSGTRCFDIVDARPLAKDMLIARFRGVANRADAEALRGLDLFAPRENLPEPEEDEFYLADLIGLRAETADGVSLGRIVAVRNFGAGDILEIAPPEGETLLFPFVKAVVPRVEISAGRVVVVPPAEIDAKRPPDA